MTDTLNHKSELTTGEIVERLRESLISKIDLGKYGRWVDEAIDRLESQEREIEEAAKLNEKQANTIAALTVRAEQAERERDLAIKALADYEDAIDPTVEQIMREFHGTEQRGQPQDGECV